MSQKESKTVLLTFFLLSALSRWNILLKGRESTHSCFKIHYVAHDWKGIMCY